MNVFVAPRGCAGKLVALDVGHGLGIDRMQGTLLKAARSLMAVQTFAVIVWFVETNGVVRLAEILYVDVV